jgi:hypothetical protein
MNPYQVLCRVCLLTLLLTVLWPLSAFGHAEPEIFVQGDFKSDGTATFQIEVDPRCFAADPGHALYLKKRKLKRMSKAVRNAYFSQAKKLIAETLRFDLVPSDDVKLDFEFRFQEKPDADPDSDKGIPVVILAECKVKLPAKLSSYQLEALKAGKFSVHFSNKIDGKKQKLNVLFPGEKSYRLALPERSQE